VREGYPLANTSGVEKRWNACYIELMSEAGKRQKAVQPSSPSCCFWVQNFESYVLAARLSEVCGAEASLSELSGDMVVADVCSRVQKSILYGFSAA
jgi:hypothetical protein